MFKRKLRIKMFDTNIRLVTSAYMRRYKTTEEKVREISLSRLSPLARRQLYCKNTQNKYGTGD